MSQNLLTCSQVDEQDLDIRYLNRTLSEAEAEAFEEHYFGCERCWAVVHRGLDVRAAASARAATPLPVSRATPAEARARRRWSGPAWVGLAAAVVIAAFGVREWQARQAGSMGSDSATVRGPGDSLVVRASATERGLEAAWPSVASAALYRVRLFTRDGVVMVEREVADTALATTWDALPTVRGDSLYWQVQALDHVRSPLGRSPLTATAARPPSRP